MAHPMHASTGLDAREAFLELGSLLLGTMALEDVLVHVADLARRTVPGASEVSVTLLTGADARSVGASGRRALALDDVQYAAGTGPCLDAAHTGRTIAIPSTVADETYPHFSAHCAEQGITTTLSVGLPIPQRTIGALNLYGDGSDLVRHGVRVAQTFAGYAAVALANAALLHHTADLAEHTMHALESRAAIEQAKGMLMGRHHCSADEAFTMLARASQRSNRKLRDIAEAMVADPATSP